MTLTKCIYNTGIGLAFIGGLLFFPALARAQASFLGLSSTSDPATLELSFLGGGSSAPAALQWTLAYSASQISSINATVGPASTVAAKDLYCNPAPGSFTCVLFGFNGNTIPLGVIATIRLTLAPNATAPPIRVMNQVAVDAFGSAPVFAPPSPLRISPPLDLGTVVLGGSISGAIAVVGGTAPFTIGASGLPDGVTSNGTGIFGTPTTPGSYTVGIIVTDATGNSASSSISFSVFGIVPVSLPGATASSPYSFSFEAAGGTPPYSFSARGLPPQFSLSSAGLLTGTAIVPQTDTIVVTVTDANGLSCSSPFSFMVAKPQPLVVRGGALSNTPVLTQSSQTLPLTGGVPPYAWTLTGGSLPVGMRLDPAGTITGVPTTPGSYTFTARTTDAIGNSAGGTFTISITPSALTIATPSPLSSGMVGVDYPVQILSASGGIGPYTFAAPPGTLPPGLALSQGGTLAGTPTVAGSSAFIVTATDSSGQTLAAPFEIAIRPFAPDLLISAGSLSFSLAAATTVIPAAQTMQIESTDPTQILSWSAAIVPSAASWVSVSPQGLTPGSFSVSLTSAAQSLAVSATPYRATIVISCNVPDSYAGKLQTVEISLLVSSAPSVLAAVTDLLSFTTSSTNPHAIPQVLEVRNTGSEAIGFGSVTCPPDWCRVRSSPISLQAGATGEVGLIADPAGLAAGYYYANLTIDSSAGATVVPITFHIEANPSLALNPSGKRLTISAGGAAAVPTQSFLVNASGTATVNWTATLLPGAPWLSLNTPGGSSSGIAPGVIGYSLNQTVASTLSPQTYYGTIRVASAEVANSPQDFQIVLEVAPATAPQIPNPSPAGLVFLASAGDGSSAVKPQVVQFFTSSVLPVNYQASAATTDGSRWLSVIPSTGIMSASSPAQSNIIVTPSGLAPGVYQGTVTYASATAAAPAVNVTLIVHAPSQTSGQVPASCIPARIISTQTGLVNNFTALAGVPTPLEIELLDDCGSAMTNGGIAANFSNGDPAFTLALTNPSAGIYGGTWTPRHSGSQVTVTAQANAPGFSTVSTQISGAVEPFTSPVLASSGTLHVFNPSPGAPLAPGTIVQIYGSELASQTMAAATLPLPTTLGGTSVSIGGLPAPLFFASPGQVNAQIPFDLAPEQSYQVILSNNGALTMPQSIQLTPATPEVLALPSGYAIAQHVSDASAVTDTSPARPGEYIVIYLSGMGATTLPVASGAVAPSGPLAGTLYAPSITLNSEPVPVLFSGLTPGLVGLYQIDTQIPADAQNGDLPLVVSQPGYQAKPVILPVSRQALP